MARMSQRQRERIRRQRQAEVERDSTMLPSDGPIADLIFRIGAELDRCIVAGRTPSESAQVLHPLGVDAFSLVGSIRGMRAVCHAACGIGVGQGEVRRGMIGFAWGGIGDERGVWISRGVA